MIAIHQTVTQTQLHAANTAALVIPMYAVVSHAPVYLAAGTGLMSFIYYSMIVFDKVMMYREKWKNRG